MINTINKKITKKSRVIAAYNNDPNLSLQELAKEAGCTRQFVHLVLTDLGIDMDKGKAGRLQKKLSLEVIQGIVADCKVMYISDMMEKYALNRSLITKITKEFDIKPIRQPIKAISANKERSKQVQACFIEFAKSDRHLSMKTLIQNFNVAYPSMALSMKSGPSITCPKYFRSEGIDHLKAFKSNQIQVLVNDMLANDKITKSELKAKYKYAFEVTEPMLKEAKSQIKAVGYENI
jgi:hypothetical protein